MRQQTEKLLKELDNGLAIYSKILKEAHPEQEVNLENAREGIWIFVPNPFDDGIKSLAVKMDANIAVHRDFSRTIPDGDAFIFADFYYRAMADIEDKLQELMQKETNQEKEFGQLQEKTLEGKEDDVAKFSIYLNPITNIYPNSIVGIRDVYNLIISDEFQNVTKKLRSITDKKEAREYKAKNFNYVTFSGIFEARKAEKLLQHSSLLCLDFDNLDDVSALKEKLLKDPFFETELMFTSPSGNGLKWVISTEIGKYPHLPYFQAIEEYINAMYNVKIDPSGKDVTRACFLPHDPDAFINDKYFKW